MSHHVLVVGTGSAGKRHARNLRSLGCGISCYDPREDRLEEARKEGEVREIFTDFNKALKAQKYDGVMIASPPTFHVQQALAIPKDTWILCEKPLSIDSKSASKLLPLNDRLLLTYTYRWWPPLQEFKKRLQEGTIGKIRNIRFTMSAHLADWHPWEKYGEFFMAKKELGGGALLDESHFIDLMQWILGTPKTVYAEVHHISDLEISSDDNVDILVGYEGTQVNLHLDLIGRPHERGIKAVGEKGTLMYLYEDNSLRFSEKAELVWEQTKYECERNDMFMGAAKEFVDVMDGKSPQFTCTVRDGVAALQIVDACRKSSKTGKRINIS